MDNILMTELDHVLNICDLQKYTESGIPGGRSLRETCRMELGHYLLYIADGVPFPSYEQAALINSVWNGVHPFIRQSGVKQVMDELSFPDVSENETLAVFMKCGNADQLVRLYDIFGKYMVSVSMNAVSDGRYRRFMDAMKKRAETDRTENR